MDSAGTTSGTTRGRGYTIVAASISSLSDTRKIVAGLMEVTTWTEDAGRVVICDNGSSLHCSNLLMGKTIIGELLV